MLSPTRLHHGRDSSAQPGELVLGVGERTLDAALPVAGVLVGLGEAQAQPRRLQPEPRCRARRSAETGEITLSRSQHLPDDRRGDTVAALILRGAPDLARGHFDRLVEACVGRQRLAPGEPAPAVAAIASTNMPPAMPWCAPLSPLHLALALGQLVQRNVDEARHDLQLGQLEAVAPPPSALISRRSGANGSGARSPVGWPSGPKRCSNAGGKAPLGAGTGSYKTGSPSTMTAVMWVSRPNRLNVRSPD